MICVAKLQGEPPSVISGAVTHEVLACMYVPARHSPTCVCASAAQAVLCMVHSARGPSSQGNVWATAFCGGSPASCGSCICRCSHSLRARRAMHELESSGQHALLTRRAL